VNRGETGKWSRGLRENFGRFIPELSHDSQCLVAVYYSLFAAPKALATRCTEGANCAAGGQHALSPFSASILPRQAGIINLFNVDRSIQR
jgi:hypothetical protein